MFRRKVWNSRGVRMASRLAAPIDAAEYDMWDSVRDSCVDDWECLVLVIGRDGDEEDGCNGRVCGEYRFRMRWVSLHEGDSWELGFEGLRFW